MGEHECKELVDCPDGADQGRENYEEYYEVDDPRDDRIPHEDARNRFMSNEADPGMFTLMINDDITKEVEDRLDRHCIDQYLADAGDVAGVTTLLDDAGF